MSIPQVVIVGRPNVGKSSILNWLAGRRISIVDKASGITRDRVTALAQLGEEDDPRFFELVDTGGIGMVDRDDLTDEVERQIDTALADADLVLFVVDIRDELMPLDLEVAHRLRYVNTPVILVMNKADTLAFDNRGAEFYKLGRGKPIPVLTHQDRNRKALLKLIEQMLPGPGDKPVDAVMKIAAVGRPNTGKSTFINTLAQAERMIVSERPGTMRDSVDVRFELDGLPFLAIDTAGARRKTQIRENVEFYSIHRAERSIRRADVVLLFIDATQGVSRLEKQLADYIAKQYKPCIFTINKWDLMANDPKSQSATGAMGKFAHAVQHSFRSMSYMPMAFITAATGKNVKALLNLAQSLYHQAQRRVGTGVLNRVVQDAIEAHAPPVRGNRTPKVYYATQVSTEPPTLVLFVNSTSLFDATYQRYLLNAFREKLPFHDIPLKLYLRSRAQTEGSPPAGPDPTSDAGSRVVHKTATARGGPAPTQRELDREINELLSELED